MFHLIVSITTQHPDDAALIADALARMRPLCLAEAGCVQWDAYQSNQSPDKFVLVEHWQTHEHWEAHGALPAIQQIYIPEILPRVVREIHPSHRLGHAL